MKKRTIILSAAGVVFVGIGVLVYLSISSMDKVIQAAVETYGSEMTQAEVRLEGIDLDVAAGQATLTGLHIGNPAGFQTEYAMKLDQLMVSLDLKSVTSDIILIKEIMIQAPSLIYERKDGQSNFDALLNNIKSYTGAEETEESESSGSKLVIEDLYINEGNVNVSYEIMQGKALSVPLPDIHLEDIGKEEEGASPGEVASEVMGSITSGLGSAVGSITEGGGALMDKAKEGIKNVGDKLKGLFE